MKLLVTSNTKMKIKLLALLAVGMLVGPMAVQAAPGGVTDGLKVWLRADTGISANDGEAVEVWEDQSGEGNHAVFNPVNSFGENAPIFDASNPGVAGQPTVRFNNVNALEIDLGFIAGSDYTIFVVNGRDRTGLANFYIAGDSVSLNTNLVLGYETVAQLRQSHFSNDLNAVVPEYVGTELWQIDTFTFDQTVGRTIYQDGVPRASDTNLVPLASNTGTTIGHFRAFGNLYWFQGDLAEVVIYDRALSGAERRAVEAELGVLYGRPYGLFEGLCDGTSDSSVTCDPATGLEWLDLTSTLGLSGDDFLADVGGWSSAGWLWGTSALVDQLLVNGGAANLDGTTNQLAVVQNLLSLLGTTFTDSNVEVGLAIADNEDGTASFPQFNKSLEVGRVFGSTIACCGSTSDSLGTFGIWAYREASVSPGTLLEELGTAVTGVGPGSSLADKINLVQTYLAVPDVQSACAMLNAFQNQVRAQRGKKLTVELADELTADAEAIQAAIGCN